MKLDTSYISDRDSWILNLCQGRRVLHLGCTDWPLTADRLKAGRLLHSKLADATTHLVGVDNDSEGIAALQKLMPSHAFYVGMAEELQSIFEVSRQQWDIILAADVLEHISNVGLALSAIRALMTESTRLVISVPSAFSAKRFWSAAYCGIEHVHPDHCYYFSPSTIQQCLARAGLEIEDMSMFMWRNPTLSNRLAAALLRPLNMLTGGRLADEMALVARIGT